MTRVPSLAGERPLVCLVTDRRQLLPNEPFSRQTDRLIAQVAAAARAGVALIHLRERDLEGAALYDLSRRAAEASAGTRARVVVNERLDIALTSGAHGVHFRSDSLDSARARGLTPDGFLVGRSIHSRDAAIASAADYLVFGTVFPSASKGPRRQAAGIPALSAVVESTAIPVLAIGGIAEERLPDVAASGAAGFAGIGLFIPPDVDDRSLYERVAAVVTAAKRAFDTPLGVV